MTIASQARSVCTIAMLLTACANGSSESRRVDGPQTDLRSEATDMYKRYGADLSGGNREALASYYHTDGALIVFNGESVRQSNSELRQLYLTQWEPPAYFAWDSLAFDPVSETNVLVTGGFFWTAAQRPDTMRFIYAALLSKVDSGVAIVFEHETLRPPR